VGPAGENGREDLNRTAKTPRRQERQDNNRTAKHAKRNKGKMNYQEDLRTEAREQT
jgi:hypothetical protein